MKRGAILVAGVVFLSTLSACSTLPQSDVILLHYRGGSIQTKTFVQCVQPSSNGPVIFNDSTYALPTSLRTWNIRPEGGDSNQPIRSSSKPVDSKPGVDVVVWATADFYLNTDCGVDSATEEGQKGKADSPLVRFWEQTGRRYGVSEDGEDEFNMNKWQEMLVNTLVSAEETSIRRETKNWTADELDAGLNNAYTYMERAMAPLFQETLRTKLGGDFFCGSGFFRNPDGTIKEVEWTEYVADGVDDKGLAKFREVQRKGKCPPIRIIISDINLADQNIINARNNVYAAEKNAEAELIRARAELEKSRILGQAASNVAYLRIRELEMELEGIKACASNPTCTVIISKGGGTNVNVTPR